MTICRTRLPGLFRTEQRPAAQEFGEGHCGPLQSGRAAGDVIALDRSGSRAVAGKPGRSAAVTAERPRRCRPGAGRGVVAPVCTSGSPSRHLPQVGTCSSVTGDPLIAATLARPGIGAPCKSAPCVKSTAGSPRPRRCARGVAVCRARLASADRAGDATPASGCRRPGLDAAAAGARPVAAPWPPRAVARP